MRCILYIALALAAFARSDAVEAFTNADLSSKISHDFAANELVNESSQKRFLRVDYPKSVDTEERMKISSLKKIIKELDVKDAKAKKLAAIKDLAKARKDAQKLATNKKEYYYNVGSKTYVLAAQIRFEIGQSDLGGPQNFRRNGLQSLSAE
eukprot:jgi/Phyca11/17666/fgenesh1_pg.PHYCAscaffold_29_\